MATHTIADVLAQGTKNAPRTFRGDSDHVEEFLEDYKLLCTQYNITTDKEKCRMVRRYCARQVKRVIEALTSYGDEKWADLKKDIMKLYDHEDESLRYRERDLRRLSRRSRHKTMTSRREFHAYQQKFIRVGGWLHQKKVISDDFYNLYFWKGLLKEVRERAQQRLLQTKADYAIETPFPAKDVEKAVEYIFNPARFNADDSELEEGSVGELSSDEDLSDEGTDDEDWIVTSRRRRVERVKDQVADGKEHDVGKSSRPKKADKSAEEAKHRDEMENLIRKMGAMKIDDPGYRILYYRAMKMDPDVTKVLRAPKLTDSDGARTQTNVANASGSGSTNVTPRSVGMRPGGTGSRCFGCNEPGHMMGVCLSLLELTTRGVIKKDDAGKYVMGDGTRIRCEMDESWVAAIE
ncbi:hypothetical protein JAAARDRAFT_130071 [Jaapia argillacea MUCL 33604]|uniref:Uncharacterized protein n=1 Tax=Jaapia argillacea MUCL 33604 TaxID=933084 RepID=A0A067Q467_9AGAM|nr:hypothetical protein JAAARDRAFT_130071 [Jaapia argillacea MUCL 33604]